MLLSGGCGFKLTLFTFFVAVQLVFKVRVAFENVLPTYENMPI